MNKNQYKYQFNVNKKHPKSIRKFVSLLYKKGCSDNTVTHYRCHINRLAKYNNVLPEELSIEHFDNYISYLTFDVEYSSDYFNQLISAAYLFYTYIRKQPFNKELYCRRPKTAKIHHYLTYEEFVSIGKHVNDFRIKVIMWLCYDAGLRCQEALNLKLDDLDFSNKTIRITNSKNNKSRLAHISPMIEKYLNEYLNKYRLDRNDSLFLFPGYNPSRPLYYSNVQLLFKRAVDKAGLTGVTLHTLRHAYVSMLFENGVAPETIQRILGHSSITTTTNYIVLTPSYLDSLPSHHSPMTKK